MKIKLTSKSQQYIRPNVNPEYVDVNVDIWNLGLSLEAVGMFTRIGFDLKDEFTLEELKSMSTSDEVELFRAINDLERSGLIEKTK